MIKLDDQAVCRREIENLSVHRSKLPGITEAILESCRDKDLYTHIDDEPIHFSRSVVEMIEKFREVLFPGYFSSEKIDNVNLQYCVGQAVSVLFDMLSEQITHVLRHDCVRHGRACVECEDHGQKIALMVLESVPALRKIMATDVRGAFEGDPAAKSHDEIIFSYPGIYAITVYRIAHRLFELDVPLLPRIMTEQAHGVTGIDIHPGACIGEKFVIDHGTGVVIGETTVIGDNVRIYQGVTLGALSLPPDAGERLRGSKRHPTIENDVIVYSGTTILGGETIIGSGATIGGNLWITESVSPGTKVLLKPPGLIYKNR